MPGPTEPSRRAALPRRRLGGLILGAAALARPAHAAPAMAGVVAEVKGQVTAQRAAQRRVLAPHADLFLGDNVATADRSRAGLQLGRDTTVRMGANARLRIDRFVVDAGGTLTLEDGPLLLDKTPGSPATVEIRGSFGLITVRGTRIFVGPSNGVIGIFVAHGRIDVTGGGRGIVLQAGEGTNIVRPGAPPTDPVLWGAARIRAALASVD